MNRYSGSGTEIQEDGKTALVLTHPFERFGTDKEDMVKKLEEQEFYDDVYYVGVREGYVPVPVQTFEHYENRRSVLPPGHGQELYDGVLEEVEGGSLQAGDVEEVLQGYRFIGIGGAKKGLCPVNTLETVDRLLEGVEVEMDDRFTYPQ
ncbi:MAG: hypothetical protein MUP63_03850 [Candidatus Nanohaloarchaeota archaeon QJJ-7]|nr:hypothetical protein [Candidatus Nanohaloarchaeota archaeon QJJ-7]